MAISDTIYQSYLDCGLLVRTNDGQFPITTEALKDAIANIALDELGMAPNTDKTLNLGGLLPNNGPTYSATLLGNHKYPVLWYNYNYSDPFDSNNPPQYSRTNLVVIFKNTQIIVNGLCLWDADSNNRNTGQIPNTPAVNKTTAINDFSNRKVYDGLGNFKYAGPQTLNSHAWYNPLLRPRTVNAKAMGVPDISTFLVESGGTKEFWVDHLKNEAGGFNHTWANYISNTYGSGVETEVLTTPIVNPGDIFGNLMFSLNDIEAMAFVTDAINPPAGPPPLDPYKNAVRTFFGYDASGQFDPTNAPGWIGPTTLPEVDDLPIVGINGVALPNVDIDSTSASSVGQEWLEYLNAGPEFTAALTAADFITIREHSGPITN